MQTSRLLAVEAFNFMAYDHFRFDFDETNIISLKGYNSSGKTTVIRAIGVAVSDMWAMKQSKFIKHGANKFEILLHFSDGVIIHREKFLSGKSSYTMYKNREVIFSTIQDGVYTSFRQVPDYVSSYLNLIDDSKLNLHLRRGRDSLLIVDTTGKENYEFLSSALRVEEITSASALLKTDRLGIKSDISAIEYEIESYRNLVSKEKVVTTNLVDYLERLDKDLDRNESKKAKLEYIVSLIEDYRKIKPVVKVKEVGVSKIKRLNSILNLVSELNNIPASAPLNKVDNSKLTRLNSILKGIEEYNNYKLTPRLQGVDLSRVKRIIQLLNDLNKLVEIEQAIDKNNKTIEEYKLNIEKLEKYLTKNNIQVFKCKNCGELQTAGLEHTHA